MSISVPAITLACCVCFMLSCQDQVPDSVVQESGSLPDKVDYNYHIKPILSDRCYKCHGPDENTRKGGLRLDIEGEAFARLSSGRKAFIKGSPKRSEAVRRIASSDPEIMMPPPESGLHVTPREIALISKWVEQGADWKPHWSLIPVSEKVSENLSGISTEQMIDKFIRDKQKEVGLVSNPPADREQLLRRVTMDLTGLPATIEEIDAFLADTSVDAYAKVVDRLLSTYAHAERLALEWLDIARYSDSHGVSFDGARNSWPYKDWVINAFHQNMPYDSFIICQVAGDLLEDPTRDQLIATSFYRMNQLESSMGSIAEEFRVEYVAERTAMTGTAFLGLTMECARCHDHKFDPISQKEFYQLSAFFNTTPEPGLNPIDGDWAPTMFLYTDEEERDLDSLDRLIDSQRKIVATVRESLTSLDPVAVIPPVEVSHAAGHFPLEKVSEYRRPKKKGKKEEKKKKTEYEEVNILDGNKNAEASDGVTLVDGKYGKAAYFDDEYDYLSLGSAGLFERNDAFSVSTWIQSEKDSLGPTQTVLGNSNSYPAHYRGWDLFLDSTDHVHVRLIHRLPDDYIEIVSGDRIAPNTWTQLGFTYDGSGMADGVAIFIDGQKAKTTILADCLKRSIYPIRGYTLKQDSVPVRVGRSYRLWTYDVGLFKGSIDDVRIFDRQLSSVEMSILGECSQDRYPDAMLVEYGMLQDDSLALAVAELYRLEGLKRSILDTVAEVMVMQEMEHPRRTYLLQRGLYNKHGEVVRPGTPEHVLPLPEDYPKNRLGLARWMTDPKNPLTSRVIINRYWQMIFGQGIVKTVEDFGNQGAVPTHPELLDWLAGEFMHSGWDLRHMIRLMVMSETYRQSSQITPEQAEHDPANIYLARGSSYRWPAEFIRDNALAASGLLVTKVGGPPVKPYQPDDFWENLGETSFELAKYEHDTLDGLYRRSIYTFQRRFAPPPFMITFDATNREICRPRRTQTNSPLQALVLMNDPQIIEASRCLSERMLQAAGSTEDQIAFGFRCSAGVRPAPGQLQNLSMLYNSALERFKESPSHADSILAIGEKPRNADLDKLQTAAMTIVANTIFNTDEFYMKR